MDEQALGIQLKELRSMHRAGRLSRQQLKSIRGQILRMEEASERENYLEKIRERSQAR